MVVISLGYYMHYNDRMVSDQSGWDKPSIARSSKVSTYLITARENTEVSDTNAIEIISFAHHFGKKLQIPFFPFFPGILYDFKEGILNVLLIF